MSGTSPSSTLSTSQTGADSRSACGIVSRIEARARFRVALASRGTRLPDAPSGPDRPAGGRSRRGAATVRRRLAGSGSARGWSNDRGRRRHGRAHPEPARCCSPAPPARPAPSPGRRAGPPGTAVAFPGGTPARSRARRATASRGRPSSGGVARDAESRGTTAAGPRQRPESGNRSGGRSTSAALCVPAGMDCRHLGRLQPEQCLPLLRSLSAKRPGSHEGGEHPVRLGRPIRLFTRRVACRTAHAGQELDLRTRLITRRRPRPRRRLQGQVAAPADDLDQLSAASV